jgi:preprotein translocase subunit SecF
MSKFPSSILPVLIFLAAIAALTLVRTPPAFHLKRSTNITQTLPVAPGSAMYSRTRDEQLATRGLVEAKEEYEEAVDSAQQATHALGRDVALSDSQRKRAELDLSTAQRRYAVAKENLDNAILKLQKAEAEDAAQQPEPREKKPAVVETQVSNELTMQGSSATTMRILVTIVLLTAALFVILSKRFQPKDKHWAYATIGTLIGFWLK